MKRTILGLVVVGFAVSAGPFLQSCSAQKEESPAMYQSPTKAENEPDSTLGLAFYRTGEVLRYPFRLLSDGAGLMF
jgi:hypothetical protein